MELEGPASSFSCSCDVWADVDGMPTMGRSLSFSTAAIRSPRRAFLISAGV